MVNHPILIDVGDVMPGILTEIIHYRLGIQFTWCQAVRPGKEHLPAYNRYRGNAAKIAAQTPPATA